MFKNKLVARTITSDPEPGTTIAANVTELSELRNPDETLFAIEQSTAVNQFNSVPVDEVTARKLLVNGPDIQWPTVRGGKTAGVLSLYVSVDRSGKVREVWPLNSGNPSLDDSARDQVKAWQFRTATINEVPVQFETILTFAFDTTVANPVVVLSSEEARKLATKIVEAKISPGTSVTVRVSVDETGKVLGVSNPANADTKIFLAAYTALRQWQFQPYLKNGKPDRFDANVTFTQP